MLTTCCPPIGPKNILEGSHLIINWLEWCFAGLWDARRINCAGESQCHRGGLGWWITAPLHPGKFTVSPISHADQLSMLLIFSLGQATANTRLVGLELAYLLKKLQEISGLRMVRMTPLPAKEKLIGNWIRCSYLLLQEDVHMIGHSLGAHTAAYAAERTPGIGRITGNLIKYFPH